MGVIKKLTDIFIERVNRKSEYKGYCHLNGTEFKENQVKPINLNQHGKMASVKNVRASSEVSKKKEKQEKEFKVYENDNIKMNKIMVEKEITQMKEKIKSLKKNAIKRT